MCKGGGGSGYAEPPPVKTESKKVKGTWGKLQGTSGGGKGEGRHPDPSLQNNGTDREENPVKRGNEKRRSSEKRAKQKNGKGLSPSA